MHKLLLILILSAISVLVWAQVFSFEPMALDFGRVYRDITSNPMNVTITNLGDSLLYITEADISIIGTDATHFAFSSVNLPAEIGANASVNIPVTLTATTFGPKTATLRIVNNQTRTDYDVSLSGTCYLLDPYEQDFEGIAFPPPNWMQSGNLWFQSQSGLQAHLVISGSKSAACGQNINNPASLLSTPLLLFDGSVNMLTFKTKGSGNDSGFGSSTLQMKYQLDGTTTWTNIGSPILYLNNNSLRTINMDLSSLPLGIYRLAFSTTSNLNATGLFTYVVIDEIWGPTLFAPVAPEPVNLIYPANAALNLSPSGFDFVWQQAFTGGNPDYYVFYLSTDPDPVNNNEFSAETYYKRYNPVTEGNYDLQVNQRYYWCVEAINEFVNPENPVISQVFEFRIYAIANFPWIEGFEGSTFPPQFWNVVDIDGGGTSWSVNTTLGYVHSGTRSVKHTYSTVVPSPGQNGWLITPAIKIPSGRNMFISFWNYNRWPNDMFYNGLLVNTTDNPNDPDWTELWSADAAASSWSNQIVNLNAYADQGVYFAFNYRGYNADDWYLDDVSIFEITQDVFPPVITHLPLLNTPRDDIPHRVSAQINDDTMFNSPIGGANLYWAANSTLYNVIPMALTREGWAADIPAQPINTRINYYLSAWDIFNNTTVSDTLLFWIQDPAWLNYDTGLSTSYVGYTSTSYGPMVMFANPFYGTGIPLQLQYTDGKAWDYLGNFATPANLHIYSWDGLPDSPLADVITPIPVSFPTRIYTIFDLTSYEIRIYDPYFFISYEDIPPNHYFNFDPVYNYGTSYVKQAAEVYTLTNSGSWCIGVQIESIFPAPDLNLSYENNSVNLNWLPVIGANGYRVYGSDDVYTSEPWDELTYTNQLSYTYSGTENFKVFRVVAYYASRAINPIESKARLKASPLLLKPDVISEQVKQ